MTIQKKHQAEYLDRLAKWLLPKIGLKKMFLNANFQYKKLRKTDVKSMPLIYKYGLKVNVIKQGLSQITTISSKNTKHSKTQIVYLPGGAFVPGPTLLHWRFLKMISIKTNSTCHLVDYPKSPEVDIKIISKEIDEVYVFLKEKYPDDQIVMIGDSVGANLIIALSQRLVKSKNTLPHLNILITPVCDSSLTNPDIKKIDKYDPILSRTGLLQAKMICANGLNLDNPIMSPIFGSMKNLPETLLFLGGNDIMYPDGKLFASKMSAANSSLQVYDEPNMYHIWPLLPLFIKAKHAQQIIIEKIIG